MTIDSSKYGGHLCDLVERKKLIVQEFGDNVYLCLEICAVYFPVGEFFVWYYIQLKSGWIEIYANDVLIVTLYPASNTMELDASPSFRSIIPLCIKTLEKYLLELKLIEIIEK